jgi:hypothetical protein
MELPFVMALCGLHQVSYVSDAFFILVANIGSGLQIESYMQLHVTAQPIGITISIGNS